MERIKRAVEIAKANRARITASAPPASTGSPRPNNLGQLPLQGDGQETTRPEAEKSAATPIQGGTVVRLSKWHLQTNRIVADDGTDPRGRSFEMLRTQLLQKVQETGFQSVGITSPTSGCGKTVSSINLAFSIARLPERTVTLIDLDMRKPQVAGYLGLKEGPSVENLLRGEAKLSEVSVLPEGVQGRLRVLPTYRASREAAEHMSSTRLHDLLNYLKAHDPRTILLVDLPPVLVVDDVLSILPNIDTLLIIAAAGQTTMTDLVNTERVIGSDKIMGVVLNKSEEVSGKTDYY
jgi:protein-tyrosine kinase